MSRSSPTWFVAVGDAFAGSTVDVVIVRVVAEGVVVVRTIDCGASAGARFLCAAVVLGASGEAVDVAVSDAM